MQVHDKYYSIRMPIGNCDVIRSINALFMNCSSASRVVVCMKCEHRSRGSKVSTNLEKFIQLQPSVVQCTVEMINRIFNRMVFSNEVDESVRELVPTLIHRTPDPLIMDDICGTHKFVNLWIPFLLQFSNSVLRRIYDCPETCCNSPTHNLDRLEPCHLVPDGRFPCQEIVLSRSWTFGIF